MKFSALNKEASNSSILSTPSGKKGRPTKEAQESVCLQLYHRAIAHQQEGRLDKAKTIYREILESELMEEAERSFSGGATSTILKLKYLIYKNLAGMARDLGDYSTAVDAYIEASSVDTSDVTLWCQLASAASLLGNLLLARKALEQALQCNGSYWPAIESLSTVLFSLQDFTSCLQVVCKGLELEPQFARGLAYLHHIFASCPDLARQFIELRVYLMQPCPANQSKYLAEACELAKRRDSLLGVVELPDAILPKKLSFISIYALGKALITIYQQCREQSKKTPSFATPVDLTSIADGVSEGSTLPPPPPSPSKRPSHPHTGQLKSCEGVEAVEEGGSQKEVKRKLWEDIDCPLSKRRSTRSKSRRKEHQSYFEMLKKYIPQWLLLDDFPEVSLLSPLNKTESSTVAIKLSNEDCERKASAVSDSIPKLSDVETVQQFLSKHQNNYGIINLLYEFTLHLARKYNHKWAVTSYLTARVFVDIYELLHTHLCFPSPFQSPADENENKSLQQLATIALCYLELYVDGLYKKSTQLSSKKAVDTSTTSMPKCFQQCLLFVEQCSGMIGTSREENTIFQLRVWWCVAKWKLWQKDSSAASNALEKCKDLLMADLQAGTEREGSEEEAVAAMEEDVAQASGCSAAGNEARASSLMVVFVANCQEDPTISVEQVEAKMQQLVHSHSFDQIFQLFENGEHSTVAEKLLPVFEQESGSYNEFLLGSAKSTSESTCLSLLLSSLLTLRREQDCLTCCVQAMVELLAHYKMGVEAWVIALKNTFNVALRCLDEEGRRETLLQNCGQRLLRRLVICIFKTMDIVYEMFDSDSQYLLLMPISLLWKLLYYIIASIRTEPATVSADISVVTAAPTEQTETDESVKDTGSSDSKAVLAQESSSSSKVEKLPLPSEQELTAAITQTDQPSGGVPAISMAEPPPSFLTTSTAPDQQRELAPSLQFLIDAHDHLGSLGWCCKDSGSFLESSVAVLRKELKILRALPQKQRETLLLELEQCYYCLYGYPYKKARARGLADHSSELIPLTWESAQILMEYYHPYNNLPTIDDTKSTHITAELLILYRKVTDILPYEGQVVSLEALTDYIEGRKDALVESSPSFQHTKLISDIYYILADDYLRSTDNHNAIRSYLNTLTYCPDQFDSWAGLALARSRMILLRLKSHDFKNWTEKYVENQTMPTVRCFQKAVELKPSHCYIIEKFGFFCYAVQAFTSQIISQPELFVGDETQKWAASAHSEILTQAETCFKQALSQERTKHSEPWIYCLMLGKAGLKLGRDVGKSLEYLLKSCDILYSDGASYPEQVEITAKGHSMEAIEMHYQLHSSALKVVLKDDSKVEMVHDVITQVKSLPLGKAEYPGLRAWMDQIFSGTVKQEEAMDTTPSEGPVTSTVKSVTQLEIAIPKVAVSGVGALSSTVKPVDPIPMASSTKAISSSTAAPALVITPQERVSPIAIVSRLLNLATPIIIQPDVTSKPGVLSFPTSTAKPSVLSFPVEKPFTIKPSVLSFPIENPSTQPSVLSFPVEKSPTSKPSVLSFPVEKSPTSKPSVLSFPIEKPLVVATAASSAMATLLVSSTSSSLTTSSFSPTAFQPIVHTVASSLPAKMHASVSTNQVVTATSPHTVAPPPLSANATTMTIPANTTAITTTFTSHNPVKAPVIASSVLQTVIPPSLPKPPTLARSSSPRELLLKECLYGVAVCAIRCPAYFKPLYRMAKVLIEVDQIKVARQLLLGPLPQPLQTQQDKLQPLFVLRTNIFHNMWQIPAEEINRPGNFSTHARRNLELLLEVLTRLRDIHALLFLAQNLKSKPDASKRYLRNNERAAMFKKVLKCCVIVLEGLALRSQSTPSKQLNKLLLDSYSVKLLVSKTNSVLLKNVERSLLTFYKAVLVKNSTQERAEDGVDMLLQSVAATVEDAVKFCQATLKTSSSKPDTIL